jgi:anaerobic ribonucleoside-triphosphate reductase activating protein
MLKYLYHKEVFAEIPNEISLAVAITGCRIHCYGCHSRELWEDKGMVLDVHTIDHLLYLHKGISCMLFMGGEHELEELKKLIEYAHTRIKTAWYCGLDRIPKEHQDIIKHLDYLKTGHYDQELGGLDSPTTNQRLYKIEHEGDICKQIDITSMFWK